MDIKTGSMVAAITALLGFSAYNLKEFNEIRLTEKAEQKRAECETLYDDIMEATESGFFDHDKILRLEKEGKAEEAWVEALRPYLPSIEIANHVKECGPFDKRYYKEENRLCRGIIIDPEKFGKVVSILDSVVTR